MTAYYTLITGASSGIGLALAELFARNKHPLILVARRKQKLETIANELSHHGVDIKVITTDLSVPGGAELLFKQVEEQNLQVDTLVNNAGRGNSGKFCEQEVEHMQGTLTLNMTSLTILTRLFLSKMKQRGSGKILNIASIAGFMPGPGFAVYHATKAYVLSLTEALNAELHGLGISVTASCPGPTESEFHQKADTLDLKGFKIASLMSAKKVAEEAYSAMNAGRPIVVHGVLNKAFATSPKLLPRNWVPRIVKTLMTK